MSTDIRAALYVAEQYATAEAWAGHPLAISLEVLIRQTRAALAAEPVGEVPSIDDIRQLCVDNELPMFVDSTDFDTVVVAILEIARAILTRWARAALAAKEASEGARLQWTENMPPGEDCLYDHCTAETPFGRFLISWRSWKQFDSPTVDEAPWGDWCEALDAFNSVDAAKAACQREMDERLAHWGHPAVPLFSAKAVITVDELADVIRGDTLHPVAHGFTPEDIAQHLLTHPATAAFFTSYGPHHATPPALEVGEDARCYRIELVTAIHCLASHFEIACSSLSGDDLRKAKNDIAHAKRIAAKHNQNGPGCLHIGTKNIPDKIQLESLEMWIYHFAKWGLEPDSISASFNTSETNKLRYYITQVFEKEVTYLQEQYLARLLLNTYPDENALLLLELFAGISIYPLHPDTNVYVIEKLNGLIKGNSIDGNSEKEKELLLRVKRYEANYNKLKNITVLADSGSSIDLIRVMGKRNTYQHSGESSSLHSCSVLLGTFRGDSYYKVLSSQTVHISSLNDYVDFPSRARNASRSHPSDEDYLKDAIVINVSQKIRDKIMSLSSPAPEVGDVGELVAVLNRISEDAREARQITDAQSLTRAAALLQQLSAPAPVPVAELVPVAERPWERATWCDHLGRCWMGDPGGQGFIPSWRLCRPEDAPRMTVSLPARAISLPQGGEGES